MTSSRPAAGGNELADLLAPFWSSQRVSEALHVPVDSCAALRQRGALLGLSVTRDSWVYPLWQFHRTPGGATVVHPQIATMLAEFTTEDPWAVAVLMVTPAPELGGHTPLEAARSAMPDERLRGFARAVAREWAAGAPVRQPPAVREPDAQL